MIPAASKHTATHAVRMTPPRFFPTVNSWFERFACLRGAIPAGTFHVARLHKRKLYFRQCLRFGPVMRFDPVNLPLRSEQAELAGCEPRCKRPIRVVDRPVAAEMNYRGNGHRRQLEST